MESSLNKGECEEGTLLQLTTNEVLVQEKKTRTIYYLPCYIRFKVKEVCEIKIEKLLGVVNGTLLFSFYYGNLPREILQQFTGEKQQKAILLQSKQSIELREDKGITYKEDVANKIIDYVVRTEFDCHLKGDVFLTPFEIVNLCMSMTVQSVVLDPKNNDGRRIDIKFNCMNSDKVTVIDHGDNIQFGNYRLADHFLDCDYHNSANSRFLPISTLNPDVRIKRSIQKDYNEIQNASVTFKIKKGKQQFQTTNVKLIGSAGGSQVKNIEVIKKNKDKGDSESKVNNFQYVHFRIPMYKYPGSNLLSIFLPLWVLAFINMTIYFQDVSFAGRLAVIATITLAFVAFLPTINDKIPQSSLVKLVQILIYLEIGSTILTIVEALTVKDKDSSTWTFAWSQSPYFVVTLIVNILAVVLVVGLFIVHKLFWEKVYLKKKEKKITQRLIKQNWQNKQCDEYFKKYITSNRMTYIQPSFPALKVKPSQ